MKIEGKDYTISVCRVLGMMMIIICHLGTALDYSAVVQLFQVGVQVFLLISGYLYGVKEISNGKIWFKNRFIKVCVPYYIFFVYALIINLLLKKPIKRVGLLLNITNLQGYRYVFTGFPFVEFVEGTTHTWFITVILLCYCLVLLLKKIDVKKFNSSRIGNVEVLLAVMFLLSILLGFFGIRIDYFVIYILGYVLAKKKINLGFFTGVVSCIVGMAARILMKNYCDLHGDSHLYLYVIIPLSYNFLAYGIYEVILSCRRLIDKICKIGFIKKILLYAEAVSYYVYLTHYQFTDGPFCILDRGNSKAIGIVMILMLTLFTSEILRQISDFVIKCIKQGKKVNAR